MLCVAEQIGEYAGCIAGACPCPKFVDYPVAVVVAVAVASHDFLRIMQLRSLDTTVSATSTTVFE